jgi:uncharacterized membrane protein
MTKNRIEAFSDGVLAIIITITVLEFKIPHSSGIKELLELLPAFISYLMSFVYVGIYWANHHHLMHTAEKVSSSMIWANMGLLFFLSLIPFTTGWMGENHFDTLPVVVYAVNLLLSGIAFYILQNVIMIGINNRTKLIEALEKQKIKGIVSMVIYALAIPCAYISTIVSAALFVLVSIMWVIPDKNIEKALAE